MQVGLIPQSLCRLDISSTMKAYLSIANMLILMTTLYGAILREAGEGKKDTKFSLCGRKMDINTNLNKINQVPGRDRELMLPRSGSSPGTKRVFKLETVTPSKRHESSKASSDAAVAPAQTRNNEGKNPHDASQNAPSGNEGRKSCVDG